MTLSNDNRVELSLALAEEKAAREQLETENQALKNDLLALSLVYDNLALHTKRNKEELDNTITSLQASDNECKTLKNMLEKSNVRKTLVQESQLEIERSDDAHSGKARQERKNGAGGIIGEIECVSGIQSAPR
jgi:hypothetical protein